jgi:ketosteroid isomerase-like protein
MQQEDSTSTDRFLIRELIDRYSYAVNERDWPAFESCFSEDAVWDVGKPFDFRVQGRSSIVEIARTKISEQDYVIQTPHATVIWLEGDRARAHSTVMEVVSAGGGATGIHMFGTYADELIRSGHGWSFARRVYRVTTVNLAPPVGDCYKEWAIR